MSTWQVPGIPHGQNVPSVPSSPTAATSAQLREELTSSPVAASSSAQRPSDFTAESLDRRRARADSRASNRPLSMVQTYQPPLMEVAQDTLPELQPIFSYINSHSNKLYQEGYFLLLHDLDTRMSALPASQKLD